MSSPLTVLQPLVAAAIAQAFGTEFRDVDPVLRPSQFADVQVNAALALAKRLGMPPREVAQQILEHLDLDDVCDKIDVSGPGFINLTLAAGWIGDQVNTPSPAIARLGVPLRATSAAPSSTTPHPTSPRRCMSAISAPRWSATR